MSDALSIAASGMHAQQMLVDSIANNLANVNTTGYKKARVSFTDLVVRGGADPVPGATPSTLPVGVGVASTARVFEPGDVRRTDGPMDLAIRGEGFLELGLPDGTLAYTRGGTLKVDADGQLATAAGIPLKPGIHVPANAEAILIDGDGRVQMRLAGRAGTVEAGRIELVRFANAQGLAAQGDGLYRATEASGEPIAGRAGEDGIGLLAQGHLEASNVKLMDEMVQLMVAQRAYEASVKVVQASDDMLGMVNGLRR